MASMERDLAFVRDRERDLERPKPITYDVGTMTSQNLPIRALLLSEAVDWRHLPLGAEMGYGWGLIPVLRDGYSSSEDEKAPPLFRRFRRLGTDTFEAPAQLLRLDNQRSQRQLRIWHTTIPRYKVRQIFIQ